MPDRVEAVLEGLDVLERRLGRLEKINQEIEEIMVDAADVIVRAANPGAPGPHIMQEIEESAGLHVVIAIGPDKEHWYYRFAETGTRPHEITPNRAKALLFVGAEHFVAWANHPGTAGRPFLRPAFDSNKGRATDEARRQLVARINKVVVSG